MTPPAETADLIGKLQASKWFRHVDAETWGDLVLRLERLHLRQGEVLFEVGDAGAAMYVVLDGCLQALLKREDSTEVHLADMGSGATVGEIQVLTGGRRTATVRAAEDSELVRIPTEVFDELVLRSPETRREMEAVNRRRLHRSLLAEVLPRYFGPLDEEAFRHLQSIGAPLELGRGETLFEQGDPGDSCYLLLRGRLAAVFTDDEGREHVVTEMCRGESVGEMALITGEPRSLTVRAVRDSRVVKIPREGFEEMAARYPQMLMAIARILIERLSSTTAARAPSPPAAGVGGVRTVALVAAGAGVPLSDLAGRLSDALADLGESLWLSRERLGSALGINVELSDDENDPSVLRLSAWLDDQELKHRFVVYESDSGPSAWTGRCMRQADLILLVASADGDPEATGLGPLLGATGRDEVASRTMLVLLHRDGGQRPRGTRRWLSALGLTRHVHLRPDRTAEVGRLARLIAGRAVGLALGGGGARAFAHIGVLRALQEAGIEVDVVGGTSLGSMIAAQLAMGWDPETLVDLNRRALARSKPHRDFTLPFVSVVSGREAGRFLDQMFSDVEIEDLWLNYFALSANLSTGQEVIHTTGPVKRALQASMAVPGVAPPVLAGQDLLVDGGLLNNLPGDVVRRLWGGRVISVDVSPETELRVASAGGQLPSARSLLWNRLNPFADKIEAPGIMEILVRASTLTSVQSRALAKAEADLYLKPPVDAFGMFDVAALEEIVEIGYEYTRRRLADWEP